ncbi:hypothetical protein BHM03_00033310 [Ensete ventricosum]|nr:hypothetical protein BHM03_00033310 [Ensete ventricosum]
MDSVEQCHLNVLILHKVTAVKMQSRDNKKGIVSSQGITITISLAAQARSTSDGSVYSSLANCGYRSPLLNSSVTEEDRRRNFVGRFHLLPELLNGRGTGASNGLLDEDLGASVDGVSPTSLAGAAERVAGTFPRHPRHST